MKIVLIENVDNLGIIGDIKDVANGYARNFLIPQKLAVKLGDKTAKILLKDLGKKRAIAKEEISKIDKKAQELEGKIVNFQAKINKKGSLFAAITPVQVSEKLKIDKKIISFAPIKTLGSHKVKLNFGHNVKANIIVNVEELNEKTIKNKKEVKK